MSRAQRFFVTRMQIFGAPDLRLKTDVHFADVVQSYQDAKPCCSRPVQIAPSSRVGQSLANCRLFQQGLEAGRYIGKVVL